MPSNLPHRACAEGACRSAPPICNGHDVSPRRKDSFSCEKMAFQLVERPAPSGLVTAAGRFVVQARMSESELGAIGNGAKIEFEQRIAAILASRPAPAH